MPNVIRKSALIVALAALLAMVPAGPAAARASTPGPDAAPGVVQPDLDLACNSRAAVDPDG